MTVAAILNGKGRDVYTESADKTLREICTLLGKHGIGAILVAEKGDILKGIISERDIVRAIAKDGDGALDQPVKNYMTSEVVTAREEDTLNEVMGVMTSGRFRHLPVVTNGRLTGLISIGDVVKYRIAQIEREADEMRHYIAMS